MMRACDALAHQSASACASYSCTLSVKLVSTKISQVALGHAHGLRDSSLLATCSGGMHDTCRT